MNTLRAVDGIKPFEADGVTFACHAAADGAFVWCALGGRLEVRREYVVEHDHDGHERLVPRYEVSCDGRPCGHRGDLKSAMQASAEAARRARVQGAAA